MQLNTGYVFEQGTVTGAGLTISLVGVLTRFREGPVTMMVDIEAMFHQVRVQPEDCDALRFLWWPDGDLSRDPEEYQMMVHLFRGVSSPTCANFALRRTADDNAKEFEKLPKLRRRFYVDDCLKSAENEQVAIYTADQLRLLLSKKGISTNEVAIKLQKSHRVCARVGKTKVP